MSKKTFDSVWDALEDTAGDAANLRARADLMLALRELVERKGWTMDTRSPEGSPQYPRFAPGTKPVSCTHLHLPPSAVGPFVRSRARRCK